MSLYHLLPLILLLHGIGFPRPRADGYSSFFFFIEVKLMSNVVLISVVQQSDSVMYTVPIFLKMFICLSQRLAVVYGI